MSTDWIKNKRQHWPEGSLKRTLLSSGCGSLLEAVEKKKNPLNRISVPVGDSVQREIYESMMQAVRVIEVLTEHFDIDEIEPSTRERLKNMQLTSPAEINLWRDSWVKVLNEATSRPEN